ncbi:hypothetical protein ABE61_11340 [Lysinibacillus sphaericus]|uniref:hypothetical protein n=1 Tax=Lysinibacillus sphaericus TaxID=1421 RepID=UPI0018CFE3C3|nr:hypothetical protein [Lysinibacillus sphaericus]MBG9454629.1 hypothetical protein [Lysinibacillus sphaericus]MBG9478495.1 hypothetical protein [Lysinibacillus sphaericus]MBG9592172.1 hypothetical protein [Lysinibacillus sphaericus]
MSRLGQQDVSHEGVITGRDAFSLRSFSGGSFALRESEASATNVLTVRKRSVSNKCFNCAKAKRQQQSE